MPESFVNTRHVPQDLGNGRVLAPGESAPLSALDLDKGTHDSRLVDEGVLVKKEPAKTKSEEAKS